MPVVSDDGRWCAVQRDSVPDWGTRTGTSHEPKARAGTVDLYELLPRGVSAPQSHGPNCLLGRCAVIGESTAFVVEEPRPDGARRLGLVRPTEEIEWLLDDGASNSCAWVTAAPGAVHAVWCRRAPGARWPGIEQAMFSRRDDGWMLEPLAAGPGIPATEGVEWSGPVISDGVLSAIQLRDGVLRAASFDASAARAEAIPTQSAILSMRGTRDMAWQSVAALGPACLQGSTVGLMHPKFGRLAFWDPRVGAAPNLAPMGASGVARSGHRTLWSTADRLWVCDGALPDEAGSIMVAEGLWLPLQTRGEDAIVARPMGRALRLYRLSFVAPTR